MKLYFSFILENSACAIVLLQAEKDKCGRVTTELSGVCEDVYDFLSFLERIR